MAVSASDSLSQIPGFCDRLGERVIVPQASGALLEHLHFCDALAAAPFFAQALKDRVARLTNFTHSSYCRVRRVQSVSERDGRPVLVSAHIAGRRLVEILDVAARSQLQPTTAGVLAVTRQMMASVALLHDFAPDGYHGALGPDRLILSAEGRVVIAEHVLGNLVEQAVAAWGVARLWREFRLATLPDHASPQYGRRNDIVQVGLVTLAMLLGRPLGSADYPQELPERLQEVTETTPDGARVPLRSGLRNWLERALALRGDSSFRTLLEAQKAFGQLLQDGGYGASSVAWDAFVGVCETAAVRVPVVVVVPEPDPATEARPASVSDVAPQAMATPPVATVSDLGAPAAVGLSVDGASLRVTDMGPAPTGPASTLGEPEDGPAERSADRAAVTLADPFGAWPVAVPAESAATLLETFLAETPAAPAEPSITITPSDPWQPASAPPVREPRSETLFEAPRRDPERVVVVPTDVHPRAAVGWNDRTAATNATSVADWQAPDPRLDPSYTILHGDEHRDEDVATDDGAGAEEEPPDPKRRQRLLVLAVLTVIATAAAVYAPYFWTVVFEGWRSFGRIVVVSDPPGAIITVDGQVLGHTPTELTLRAGEHLLEVQSGGSAKSKKLTIQANGKITEKMTFPEAGERGGLRISTYPTTGRITLDGVPRGDAPVRVTDLSPGTHTLVVETALSVQEQDVIVQPGRVSLLAVPTASWLKVTAPYDLRVFENGRALGTTGSAPVMVPPGRHNFEFVNQSLGLKLRQYVDAAPGQLVLVPLELPVGMMNLFADQTAEVFVDGHPVGQTPLSALSVPLGPHDVVFRHAKYGEVRYTVSVTLAAPVRLSVAFRR